MFAAWTVVQGRHNYAQRLLWDNLWQPLPEFGQIAM